MAGKRRPKYTVYVELTNEDGSVVDRIISKKEVNALDKHLAEVNCTASFARRKRCIVLRLLLCGKEPSKIYIKLWSRAVLARHKSSNLE